MKGAECGGTMDDRADGRGFESENDECVARGPGAPGLLSVVIPTYNRAYIIAQTIDSVLSQTYANIEVIVVDDGSTDNTAEIVARYDTRVRYITQQNAGVSAARNRGLQEARGEFIALLDSDDQWLPWKAEAQVAILRAFPRVGMVWTDMVAVDEHGLVRHQRYLREMYTAHRKLKIEEICRDSCAMADVWPQVPTAISRRPVYIGEIFSQMTLGNLVHTSTCMLTRERLRATGLFDPQLRYSGEDYDFHVRTTMHGPVALLDEPSILYRVGAGDQLTSPALAIHRARNNLTTVRRALERGAGRIDLPEHIVRGRLAEAYEWLAETELQAGDQQSAMRSVWRSLRYRPNAKAALLLPLTLLPAPSFWFYAARRAKKRMSRMGSLAARLIG